MPRGVYERKPRAEVKKPEEPKANVKKEKTEVKKNENLKRTNIRNRNTLCYCAFSNSLCCDKENLKEKKYLCCNFCNYKNCDVRCKDNCETCGMCTTLQVHIELGDVKI